MTFVGEEMGSQLQGSKDLLDQFNCFSSVFLKPILYTNPELNTINCPVFSAILINYSFIVG